MATQKQKDHDGPMKRARKKTGCKLFLALKSMGPMKQHGYLGSFTSFDEAARIANEHYLHAGGPTYVLETDGAHGDRLHRISG